MALLLSSKFVRSVATVARGRCGYFRGHTYAYRRRTYFEIRDLMRNFSTSTGIEDTKLDRSLRRLDQDVRRVGRVTRRELEDVLGELKLSKSATSTQSLLIIRCCGSLLPEESSENRTQLVEEIWKMLKNLGVPMDISHYNALLRVYLENEHPFSPTEFLADLESKGIEPNRVTYQRLVERYCQGGDIEGATRILEFMRTKQLPVNENIFNSLILGHSQAGDMTSAADTVNVMKHAGLEPSGETFTTLLCGYAKYGDMESIRTILEQCRKEDIPLFDQDYMDILYTLTINGHQQHVDEIIGKFQYSVGFNQEAFRLILKLTNQGKFDVAKKILLTMSRAARDGQLLPSGSFFIKQLVKANCPVEETVTLCEELQRDGLNDRSLLIAAETSLSDGKVQHSFALLSALRSHGYSIKQHYFWPLIVFHGKTNNSEGIVDVLQRMSAEFQLSVNGETLRDYAIPWLLKLCPNNTPEEMISMLRRCRVSIGPAVTSIVHVLLSQNKIADALHTAHEFHVTYNPGVLRRPLLEAYHNTKDAKSFAGILKVLYTATENAGVTGLNSNNEDDFSQLFDRFEMVGQILLDAVSKMKGDRLHDVETLLEAIYKEGLGVSNSVAERLVENLGADTITSGISSLLEKLTTGEILSRGLSKPQGMQAGGEIHLKSLIRNLSANNEPSHNVKKQLLALYCKNRDLEKAEEIWKELRNNGISVRAGVIAQLIDLYTSNERLDNALDLFNYSQSQLSDFVLDKVKVVKLANLLVKRNDLEGALSLLSNNGQLQRLEENTYMSGSACRQLLNYFVEGGQVENLKRMFDCLIQHGYIEISNNILGPLIKVHLARNDLDSAMNAFEECCHKYHCTPLKNEITCKLILAEDALSLQKLTDLSTKVHGEVNSLYDLVFAFVECGRIRQARKILETPGLLSRPQRVQSACKRYCQEGNVSSLEGLVEATKSLPHVDPSDIYQHLLATYCQQNDAENAMGLWVKIQEENVQPTDEFLIVLGNFLKNKGLAVPFVIPEQGQKNLHESNKVDSFTSAIEQNRLSEALEVLQSIPDATKLHISRQQFSKLLLKLMQSGKEQDVRKLLLDMLQLNIQPSKNVLQEFLENIASSGDINTLQLISKYLSKDAKRNFSFENKMCEAHIAAGKASEYLDILEKEVDEVTPSDMQLLNEKFPKRTLVILLQQHPELLPQFQKVCEKYFKLGSLVPFNTMWLFYTVKKQFSSADEIWNQYMSTYCGFKYHSTCRFARENLDLDLANYVVEKLKQSAVEKASHGFAYSCVVDILLSSGKISEALEFFIESKQFISHENFTNATLERLRNAEKEHGLSVEIPQKTTVL